MTGARVVVGRAWGGGYHWMARRRSERRGGGSERPVCLLTRALACGYVRSSRYPSFSARHALSRFSLSLSFSWPFSLCVASPSALSLSLRDVLLPSHREVASKQEPIWISVDLSLFSSVFLFFFLFQSMTIILFPMCFRR